MKTIVRLIGLVSLGFALLGIRPATSVVGPVPNQSGPNPHQPGVPLKLELQSNPLAVKFINMSNEPLRILKPLDGSEWSWIMPYYKLTVTTKNGHEMPIISRCARFGLGYNKVWPDGYMVTINPGESYLHIIYEHVHKVPKEGLYTVQFEYQFTPNYDQLPGRGPRMFLMSGHGSIYPPNLWRGTATSNTIVTKLTKP